MFEVGAQYEFKMLDGGEEATFGGVVERYEYPLLKLEDGQSPSLRILLAGTDKVLHETPPGPKSFGLIINVTSPCFVSAQRMELDK